MMTAPAGNERTLNTIKGFINSSHIPHAIIIEGEDGLGKHTFARFIASSVVCTSQDKPCGICRNCRLLDSGNHPDIIYLAPQDKKKSITVEQVRTLRNQAYIKPHMDGYKLFIIEKADMMSDISQNALLKVLEEPPQNIVFILLAQSCAGILETILSRCVTLSLFPPKTEQCFSVIRDRVKKGDEDIYRALSISHNNIGRALTLLNKKKNEKSELALAFSDALFSGKSDFELLKIISKIEKDRILAAEFLQELKLLIVRRIKKTNSQHINKMNLSVYEAIREYEPALDTNINLALFCSALVCRLKECI